MKSGFCVISSVLLVLVSLSALFIPGCTGVAQGGAIEVKATLCGEAWQGEVSYTLALAEGMSPVYGAEVPGTYTMDAGNWVCAYVSGGPARAYLVDITPSAAQELREGGRIAFTLNFELEQDAATEWLRWTVDEKAVGEELGRPLEYKAEPCQIVDVHFRQWLGGCCGQRAAVSEWCWLTISQTAGEAGVKIWVANEGCSVVKTPPPQGFPPMKKSQVPSVNSEPVQPGSVVELPSPQLPVTTVLDVQTTWDMGKCLNYTESVNWLGITRFPFEPPGHGCVLFELILPGPGQYVFTLVASTEVELADGEDINPRNNHVESPPLTLVVNVGS